MNSIMKQKKTEVVVKPDDQVEAAYNAWTSEENRGNYQANLTDFDMEDKSHKTEEGLEVRLLFSPSGERKFREFASTKGMENMKTLNRCHVLRFFKLVQCSGKELQKKIAGKAHEFFGEDFELCSTDRAAFIAKMKTQTDKIAAECAEKEAFLDGRLEGEKDLAIRKLINKDRMAVLDDAQKKTEEVTTRQRRVDAHARDRRPEMLLDAPRFGAPRVFFR